MAKRVDITEKLNFEEKPVLVIRDTQIKVNNEAVVVLKAVPLFENFKNENITKTYELLFDKSERDKIDALKLGFIDWLTVITEAITLVIGDEVGEIQTLAMT